MSETVLGPRISVEEGLKAYRVTGLIPFPFALFEVRGFTACGLGVMAAIELKGKSIDWQAIEEVVDHSLVPRYGQDYLNGFITGFDGGIGFQSLCVDRVRQGVEDGSALREAVDRDEHLIAPVDVTKELEELLEKEAVGV